MPTSKHRPEHEDLSDALLHELVAGDAGVPTTAPHRLRGWPDALTLSADGLAGLWGAHRDTLTAEAEAAAFVPWAAIVFDRVADSAASRKARITWSRRFHQERGY